ncbi:hypothetical protein Tco_0385899 [Tanacetum coccineum]
MASELRLHYDHEIMTRDKSERKFTDCTMIVQQRNAQVTDLKAMLDRSEAKAMEVVELCKHVSDLEVVVAVKTGEVSNLNTHNAGLLEKVFALKLVCRELYSKVSQLTADCDGCDRATFCRVAAKMDARIADVRRDMDNDLYPNMLTAIAGRRWVIGHSFLLAIHQCTRSVECRSALGKVILMAINKGIQQGLEAGIVHGKAGRSLTQIEAYDPMAEGKYVVAVFAFENMSFPLLDELEGLKDSSLTLIMSALTLKDDHGNFGSIDHEMLLSDAIPPIYGPDAWRGLCPPPGSTLGGAASSAPPHDSSLGVVNYQISTLVLSGDGGSATQPPIVQAYDDLFDTSVLDGLVVLNFFGLISFRS